MKIYLQFDKYLNAKTPKNDVFKSLRNHQTVKDLHNCISKGR